MSVRLSMMLTCLSWLLQVCKDGGAWLVLDNTYEDFVYTPECASAATALPAEQQHKQQGQEPVPEHATPTQARLGSCSIGDAMDKWYCPSGPHVLHIFSFSKASAEITHKLWPVEPDRPQQQAAMQALRRLCAGC